jgi:hypothetical protein
MADQVGGVFDEAELQGLSEQDRDQLKQQVLQQLHNNLDIRARINEDPGLLTSDDRIREILGGVTEAEVAALSEQDRDQLKQQLQNNPDIRARINEAPGLLTRDPGIRGILKRDVRPR